MCVFGSLGPVTEVKTDIYVTSFGPVSDVEMVCISSPENDTPTVVNILFYTTVRLILPTPACTIWSHTLLPNLAVAGHIKNISSSSCCGWGSTPLLLSFLLSWFCQLSCVRSTQWTCSFVRRGWTGG